MTESGTKSKRPRPNTTGDVRSARAVADGGNGSPLDHRPTLLDQRVAHPAPECRSVDFDLVAASTRRLLVALAAGGRVEQGAEPRRGCEDAVEHEFAAREPVELLLEQTRQGIPGLDGLLAAEGEQQDGDRDPGAGHGAPTLSFSIWSATRPALMRRHSARTTSPGFSSARRDVALAVRMRVVRAVVISTTRSDNPTPVISSSVPVRALMARMVPR